MPDLLTPLSLPSVRPNILPANWIEHVRLSTTFNVDTSSSHVTGVEQRRLLGDRPVRTMTARITAGDRKRSTALLGNLLRASSQIAPVPLYCDQSVTTAAATSTVLTCPTTLRRFFVGGRVLVHHYDGDGVPTGHEYGIIDSLTSTTITIRSPGLSLSHAVGSVVYPCMDAEINLSSTASLRTDAIVEVDQTWLECYGKSALPVVGPFDALPADFPTYSPVGESVGVMLPVFNVSPNWGLEQSMSIVRPGERFATGRAQQIETYTPRPVFSFLLQLLRGTRSAAWDVVRFWHSRCGSHLPFMLPNPQVLFSFIQQNGTDEIWVQPYGNAADIGDFIKYVMIRSTSGTIYIMKLTSATVSSGHLVLKVDALPGISDGSVAEVTSVHMVKFKTDEIVEEWLNDEVCSIGLEAIEIVEEIASEITDIETLS